MRSGRANAIPARGADPGVPDGRPPVIFFIYQTGSQANGGVNSVSQILEGLERFRPIVVTQRETRATQRWRALGIEVHVLRIPDPTPAPRALGRLAGRGRRALPMVAANAKIAALVRRSGARVVHCNDILSFWHAAPGARAAGARVVFNVRGMLPADRSYGLKWRATHLLADEVVALSDEMRSALVAQMRPLARTGAVAPARIRRIYSIVDTKKLRPIADAERREARLALGIDPSSFAIGYIGAFSAIKNQLDYIERGIPELRKRRADALTYFIGDFAPDADPYARRCAEAAARTGAADRARFVGYTDAVHKWYQALDLVCIASGVEGLARSMIESLASGTPVVSFDVCSAREILEGYGCGIVVRQGDYAALVDAIVQLAGDSARRSAMGRAGREMATRLFGANEVRRLYERLYDGMVMGSPPDELSA